jgi:hypothetical protein
MSEATNTQTPAEAQSPESEVSDPFAGFHGTRNGVKVPLQQKFVLKGTNKGTPYVTLNFNALDDSALITAAGIPLVRNLIEAHFNVAGRNNTENLLGEKYTSLEGLDMEQVQAWADGIVEERVPTSQLRKRFFELMMKATTTQEEDEEAFEIRAELRRRTK